MRDASTRGVDPASAEPCGSVQTKGDTPGTISIKVAPAPPPSGDEYPEIKAAVQAAQKEVKAGAKLKFSDLYRLGQVVGTGHYARVQLAMSLKDGRRYAVKILPKADGKEALVQQLQSESH
jgi:serine/threonine protein kinase